MRNYALRKTKAALTHKQLQNPGETLLDAVVPFSEGDETASSAAKPAVAGKFLNHVLILEFGATKWIHHNLTPLTPDLISNANPKRVNVLMSTMSTINFS